MNVAVRRIAVCSIVGILGATQGATQVPRYDAAALACAVFFEEVRTTIRSQRGVSVVDDRAGRDGVLIVRALESEAGIGLQVWYDSLAVWRETEQGIERAAPDGFLGGRYVGILEPLGAYHGHTIPFVPGALAELTDIGSVLEDFFPVLPAAELESGEAWRSGPELEIRRAPNRRSGGESFEQYRWRRATESTDTLRAQGAEALLSKETSETGQLLWSRARGPMTWNRRINVTARLPRRRGVRQALVSEVEQEIWVTRRLEHPECPPDGSP